MTPTGPRRALTPKGVPSNTVYDVTDGLVGVDEQFLRAVKDKVQAMLFSDQFELPRDSSAAARIMRIAGDPNADIDKVVELVQTDAFLAGKLLSLINSAYFSTREPVSSLRHAIVLLGMKSVADLVFCASVRMTIFKSNAYANLMSSFWVHSIATAVASEALSQHDGGEPGFIAGLVHDIGKPALLVALVATEKDARNGESVGEDAAMQLIQQLHEQVGGLMARRWGLSDEIQEAIRDHGGFRPDGGRLALYVYCANRVAHHLGFGGPPTELTPSLDPGLNAIDFTSQDAFDKLLGAVTAHTKRLVGAL